MIRQIALALAYSLAVAVSTSFADDAKPQLRAVEVEIELKGDKPAPDADDASRDDNAKRGVEARRIRIIKLRDGVKPGERIIVLNDDGAAPGPRVVIKKPEQDSAFEMRKVAYLGVSTSPVPLELATHLKLPEGFGLIIEHVAPDSPAAEAGFKRLDVIHKLGDQLIVNALQLGTLVRSHKPGDEVTLTVFRQGESKQINATLIEKEMPVRKLGRGGDQPVDRFGNPLRDLEWPDGVRWRGVDGVPLFIDQSHAMMRYSDDEHDLTLRQTKDGKQLTVKDKQGNVIFEGPIESEAQRRLVPQAVRPKLETLEKSSRLNIRRLLPEGDAELEFDADRLNELMQRQLKDLKVEGLDPQELQKRVDEMRRQIEQMIQKQLEESGRRRREDGGAGAASQRAAEDFAATAVYSDGTHKLELHLSKDGKRLKVTDDKGNVLFGGPIDSAGQRDAVPAEVKPKLEQLEKSARIELRSRQEENNPTPND